MLQNIVDDLKLNFTGAYNPDTDYNTNDVYIKKGHPFRIDKYGVEISLMGKSDSEIDNALKFSSNGVISLVKETRDNIQVADQLIIASQDGTDLELAPSMLIKNSKIKFIPQTFDGAQQGCVAAYNCLPTSSGGVITNGYAYAYSLGTGNLNNQNQIQDWYTPPMPKGFNSETIKQVAAGYYCTYLVNEEGQVVVWGFNSYGQLGVGHTSHVSYPTLISTLPPIEMIVTNSSVSDSQSAYAICKNGDVYVCGHNNSNALGFDNNSSDIVSWTKQPFLKDIINGSFVLSRVNLGTAYMVDKYGSLFAIGRNDSGEGANGNTYNNYTPHKVEIIESGIKQHIIQSWLSGMYHYSGGYTGYYKTGMVLTSEGNLYLIGYLSNSLHPVNNGTQTSFIKVTFPAGAGKIVQASIHCHSAPYSTVIALDENGIAWTFGSNVTGQLGNGTSTANSTPQKVQTTTPAIGKAVKVASITYGYNLASYGYGATAIINEVGELWVCGWNRDRRLGVGYTSGNLTSFQKVPFDYRVATIQDIAFIGDPDDPATKLMVLDSNGDLWYNCDQNGYNENAIASSTLQKINI